jgi:IS5 family transposase
MRGDHRQVVRPFASWSLKPRTYREKARKAYLNTAKKKKKTRAELKVGIGKQLRYVNRDLKTIDRLLCAFSENPMKERERTYVETIRKVLVQKTYMRRNKTHSVVVRIVSIHQPQVRPIVRGKEKSMVEFGSKINVSLVEGYVFLDHLSWDAYNEGEYLMKSVELYKDRHGYYPAEVLADMIYCNRENRRMLKDLCIKLLAKPLGRPSATNSVKLNPVDRNPIEGKFGQAKVRYGMGRIKARLKDTRSDLTSHVFTYQPAQFVEALAEVRCTLLPEAARIGIDVQLAQPMSSWRISWIEAS